MSSISTHVLDIAKGGPAKDVPVRLERWDGAQFVTLREAATNADGRVGDLVPRGGDAIGVYRITFDTGAYFAATGTAGFYPYVPIVFEIRAADEHYHVPLLIGPYGYSTYRGS